MALRPWDIANLCEGAVRVVAAPISQAIPTNIADAIGMIAPYNVNSSWFDFGAAKGGEGGEYSRSIESEGQDIEQESGAIMTSITDIGRSFAFNIAEIAEDNLVIIENAGAVETVAAAPNKGAQQAVPIGTFEQLEKYRIGFIGVRPKDAGIVTEPVGGITRGRLLACFLNRVTLSADEASLTMEKGSLWSADVTFEGYPEPGEDTDESYGRWLSEAAGTISAT